MKNLLVNFSVGDKCIDSLEGDIFLNSLSKFKTFDKSGNGNHGQLYETEEFVYQKNLEFNKFARPAKIV